MTVLLDTHTWVWLISEPERLSTHAREVVLDKTNLLLVSAASAWELAIKLGLGRGLRVPAHLDRWFLPALERSASKLLAISLEHVMAVEHLPWHHRDPFDRLLIAQAQCERLPIRGRDARFAAYGVETIWE
jgi:PIN domain nuclease of toxin-antitoxin system